MKIEINQPIELSAIQYKEVSQKLQGYCAFQHDPTNNKYFVKVWHKGAIPILESILKKP